MFSEFQIKNVNIRLPPFQTTSDCKLQITVGVKIVAWAQILSENRNTNCKYIFYELQPKYEA
jgi:hypothetical protein